MNVSNQSTQHGRESASRILDAAERVFARHGFAGSSTRAVADEAGANIGQLAYYFGSKEGLFEAVIARAVQNLMTKLNQMINDSTPAPGALRIFLAESAGLSTSASFALPVLTVRESLGTEQTPISTIVAAQLEPHRTLLQQILERGVRNGDFRPTDPMAYYAAAMGAISGATGLPSLFQAEKRTAGQPVIDLLVDALGRNTAPAPLPAPREVRPARAPSPAAREPNEDPFVIGMID